MSVRGKIGHSAGPGLTEEHGFLPRRLCLPWAVDTKATQREKPPQAWEGGVLSKPCSPRASARPQPGGGRASSWGCSHAVAPLCPTPPSISGPPASFPPEASATFSAGSLGVTDTGGDIFSPVLTPAHFVLALCPTVCSTLKTYSVMCAGGGHMTSRDW